MTLMFLKYGRVNQIEVNRPSTTLELIMIGPILATGGQGEIRKATYNGEAVAVKSIYGLGDRHVLASFLKEIKLLR
jgi:hypothetical protein